MKIHFLILFCLLFVENIIPQNGWYVINHPYGNGAIYFKDANNGIVGNYKTTDGGQTWIQMDCYPFNLEFIDSFTGYATSGSFILKTSNFGDNWSYTNILCQNACFLGFDFINSNTGYTSGCFNLVFKTTNGGNNWATIRPLNTTNGYDYCYASIHFTNEQTGYIAGFGNFANDSSIFMKTIDGGSNWDKELYLKNNWGSFYSMYFLNSYTGFIGTEFPANILITENGGTNWNTIPVSSVNTIYYFNFPDAKTGYAACDSGKILKTTNFGNSWFLQTTGVSSNLYRIYLINNQTGYATGQGVLLKTTDGGGAPEEFYGIPKKYELHQNYPNPFNSKTRIKFDIPEAIGMIYEHVLILLYDLTGREVESLVNNVLAPGTYEVEWDASNYPSGVYFYKILAGDFSETKKMVLVR